MSLGRVLDIGKNALMTYQGAMDVTSNNIANVSNEDYTKQVVTFGSEKSVGQFGTGVKIADIQRVRNVLVDKQLRSNYAVSSEADTRSTILSQVETLAGETTDNGVSTSLTEFLNSWDELSANPSSSTLRSDVVQKASDLSTKFQNLTQNLGEIKSDLVGEFSSKVDTLNKDLEQIKSLNQKIYATNTVNQSASDLEDQRDKLVDEVSKMGNTNITTDDQGSINISIGGVFAVDKNSSAKFVVSQTNGELNIVTQSGNTPAQLNSGELYAYTDLYTNKITGYLNKLDDIGQSIVDNVNKIHSTGTDINGKTGVNFFSGYSNGSLVVNQDIVDDPNKIAASSDGTSGNGDIAVKIADLKDTKALNGKTLLDNFSSLVSAIGADKVQSDNNYTASNLVVQQLQNQKSSYSGVSEDEELTNVIKFQRSYAASSKIVSVADQMLQTLIDMV